ncbi:ATP-binding protein [Filomicrobium sp.]|uniref:ATP-binding protein n=1 Tax=Filomicrobium sp. TaxID=2024831 RepID=UPI0025910190|nr:ATP-binding protein [Filomicrobium sp.]MCV0371854.1 ATP-binding protein [Filomicrobium sp.]
MASTIKLGPSNDDLLKVLEGYIQSGNLSFLIGSGASLPAIPLFGNIESDINQLLAQGKDKEADSMALEFIEGVEKKQWDQTNADTQKTQSSYVTFLRNVDQLLFERKNILLARQANIPLLICRKIYQEHKVHNSGKALTIIIDEAHNILSRESFREAESWKDYRLETFEEIIKEGRKFGVFVTIASQRPNDISHTITSQAHNYFIHRLINQRDLESIASAVSYIDKLTEESIPTLPTGTCIFSGIAGQMPLKLVIKPLDDALQPKSTTVRISDLVPVL